jgi:hypothetical protein
MLTFGATTGPVFYPSADVDDLPDLGGDLDPIVLDEPTEGLTPKLVNLVATLLARVAVQRDGHPVHRTDEET